MKPDHEAREADSYREALGERVESGRSSTRSVRLAMAPAAALLKAAISVGRIVPEQKVLDAYLRRRPGQRAALSGFVRHLRVTLDTELKLPPHNRRAAERRRHQKLREAMLELMRGNADGSRIEQRWIAASLGYFHNVPRKVAERVVADDVSPDREGLTVQIRDKQYWIPLRRARQRVA